MSFVAAATAGVGLAGSVIGGVIQGNAAKSAAEKQAAAAEQANALQEKMYNQTREDNAAYRGAGQTAVGQMQDPTFQKSFQASDFQKDPGYDFRMQQGQQALERSAAAKGGLNSGGTMRSLSRYGQDYASNEYGKAYDRFNNDKSLRYGRLSTLAGMGLTANGMTGQAGQNYANSYGQNTMQAGEAAAAGDVGKGNAMAGIATSIGSGAAPGSWMKTTNAGRGA